MPHVSVIIPCFNAHHFLKEAIESIQQQTYKDMEVLVVNDGSTDTDTLAALGQLPNEIIILHKQNGGLASARNFGIAHSQGNVIVTLDSDDKFHKTFVAKAVRVFKNDPAIGVVSSYVQEFGSSHNTWRAGATDDFSFFTENRIVACCAFRKECWTMAGGYDEVMRSGAEDWEFWIRVTQLGWKVHVIPEKLFFYRKTQNSMLAEETRPKMAQILNYMISKHHDWFIASLKKGILEKQLINKKNLTFRRIIGLFIEKLTGKF
jgi:glycosyltransferase involved in cell wall biosynthesis